MSYRNSIPLGYVAMAKVACSCLLAALLAGGMGSPVAGLTVYRLGGEDLPPPPEVEEGKADFVQFSWADLDPDLQGVSESLVVEASGISPLFFFEDENIAPTVKDRGGYLHTQRYVTPNWLETDDVVLMNDGNPETAYFEEKNKGDNLRFNKNFLFDLGSLFAVDRIRFSTRAGHEKNYIEFFQIWTNTLTNDEAGISRKDLCTAGRTDNCLSFFNYTHREIYDLKDMYFNALLEVKENTKSTVNIEFTGEYIRRVVLFVPSQLTRDWEIAEFEIFAPGFVPDASYTSNILDLGREVTLGSLRWSGYKDADATVNIRSQSGSDPDPNIYWRNTFRGNEQVAYGADGRPLTRRTYQRLEISERGKITRDAENWDFWSTAYDFRDGIGTPLPATRPRRYVQFQVDFASDIAAGSRLDYVEFTASPPAVTALVGEIDPWRVETAQVTQFTYAIRPTIAPDDSGFDHLEISANGGSIVSIDGVRIGGEEVAFTRVEEAADHLVVGLPRIDVNRTEEVIEVDFSGETFRYGATFSGRVFDSNTPQDIQQPVQPGDATALRDGNTLSVQALSLGSEILSALDLGAGIFTPNGDGVNEGLDISYDLLKLVAPTQVVVEMRDLAGGLVRQVYDGLDVAGRHVRRWDGRDGHGQRVLPGVYICRVETETEDGRQQRSGVVAVAY